MHIILYHDIIMLLIDNSKYTVGHQNSAQGRIKDLFRGGGKI